MTIAKSMVGQLYMQNYAREFGLTSCKPNHFEKIWKICSTKLSILQGKIGGMKEYMIFVVF